MRLFLHWFVQDEFPCRLRFLYCTGENYFLSKCLRVTVKGNTQFSIFLSPSMICFRLKNVRGLRSTQLMPPYMTFSREQSQRYKHVNISLNGRFLFDFSYFVWRISEQKRFLYFSSNLKVSISLICILIIE